MSHMTPLTGPERWRRWSGDITEQILAEAFSPGATVADVARLFQVSTSLIYKWRRASLVPPMGFAPTPDRKGEHPRAHLSGFRGILQADGYAGFAKLYCNRIVEAACLAHARRKFWDVYEAAKSPLAREALDRIAVLYRIEDTIRGKLPDQRLAVRAANTAPLMSELRDCLDCRSQSPETVKAMSWSSVIPSSALTSSSFGDTDASRSRCLDTDTDTKNTAAISSYLWPFPRRVRKARN